MRSGLFSVFSTIVITSAQKRIDRPRLDRLPWALKKELRTVERELPLPDLVAWREKIAEAENEVAVAAKNLIHALDELCRFTNLRLALLHHFKKIADLGRLNELSLNLLKIGKSVLDQGKSCILTHCWSLPALPLFRH